MEESLKMFLTFCGAIVTMGGATAVIRRWILPAIKLSNRVKKLEDKDVDHENTIKDLVDGNNLMLECMVYLIRNARTKNSIVDLERMEQKIIGHMANRGGQT